MPDPAPANLFVYGTLLVPAIFRRVTGLDRSPTPATASGFIRFRVRDECWPAARPEPGATLEGAIYRDLPPDSLARLDDFEGDHYLRASTTVTLADRSTATAWIYVLRPAHYHLLSDEPWSLESFRESATRQFAPDR